MAIVLTRLLERNTMGIGMLAYPRWPGAKPATGLKNRTDNERNQLFKRRRAGRGNNYIRQDNKGGPLVTFPRSYIPLVPTL